MAGKHLPENEQAEEADFRFADGVFVKSITVRRAGCLIPQHSHGYDHTSFIAAGEVHAWKDWAYLGRFTAPCGILIEAGVKHAFLTETDNTTILCIHNLHGEEAVKVLAEHKLTPEDALALVTGEL